MQQQHIQCIIYPDVLTELIVRSFIFNPEGSKNITDFLLIVFILQFFIFSKHSFAWIGIGTDFPIVVTRLIVGCQKVIEPNLSLLLYKQLQITR